MHDRTGRRSDRAACVFLFTALLLCCNRGRSLPDGAKPSVDRETGSSQPSRTDEQDRARKRVGLKDLPGARQFKLGAAFDYVNMCDEKTGKRRHRPCRADADLPPILDPVSVLVPSLSKMFSACG